MTTYNFLKSNFSRFFLLALMFATGTYNLAQEGSSNGPDLSINNITETTKTSETWYTNPLYLIIGGLLLVIIIVALARGGRKS